MKSFVKKWNRDDIPNKGLKEVSDVIGINAVKALLVKCPGMTFHIPKKYYSQLDDSFLKKHRKEKATWLAHKLGLSVRTIYRKLQKLAD
jgi:hypothetical protein